ncbi:MAG: hypothetical protein U5K74_07045 [Gemmatimonadaceae bacterium]|nr:hypothetical protein [Gemmatimonadaceae bacterium]
MIWRSLLHVVALAGLTACTTLSNTARSYLTAPNGLQIDDDRVRSLLQRGLADSALRAVGNRKSPLSPDDRLLRLLYQASAARYAGHARQAGSLFDQAYRVSEDRFTKSVSRTAASMVTNDYALPYTAGRNERLLLHYNALLAWSADGDPDAAAVEARRLVALLASFGDPDEDERPMRAMLHTIAAAAFEQAGDWSDADVARRNAVRLGAVVDTTWSAPADSSGDVVVVIERGDVAHKVAVGLTIPIFSDDNANASDGRFAAQRMLADFGALRNGGIWWDDAPSWRFTQSNYGRWRGARASYLLDMSWPVLRRASLSGGGAVQVQADGLRAEALLGSVSISDAIAADYRRDRGAILSRTVSRAVTKYLAARAVEAATEASAKKRSADSKKKKGKKDDDGAEAAAQAAGLVARLFTNAAATALERADTRAWTLLPGTVSVLRLRLPAGTHEVLVDAGGTQQLSLPDVVVRGGRTTVISARLWREAGQGVRSMVERSAANQPTPQR